jgi:putative FmdB family regulatory protein
MVFFQERIFMPIYTYKCKNCEKELEKFKSMNSNGSEVCDECGSEAVRVFSPAGIIFKGSGFYTTDYKSGSSKANINTGAKSQEGGQQKSGPQEASSGSSGNDKVKDSKPATTGSAPGSTDSKGQSEK